eukprot:TRINITY_DN76796_c0_g1_i1.p1 TRINITY_DN76796_c0_g1~~TRINITY_DN76796_c0_g1_i1.p1  ORF type:complete len:276 (+),score=28.03 TRINITY_DN76796_c0_g1_i1:64-891(+)
MRSLRGRPDLPPMRVLRQPKSPSTESSRSRSPIRSDMHFDEAGGFEDVPTPFSGDILQKPEDYTFLTRAADVILVDVAKTPARPQIRGSESGGLVLDVGCGPHCQGASVVRGHSNCRVIGIDVDVSAARQASKKMSSLGCDIVVADMDSLHLVLRPGIFDLLLCYYALQHVRSPIDTLGRLKDLVNAKHGGIAVAAFGDRFCGTDDSLPSLLRSCYRSFLAEDALVKSVISMGFDVKWTEARSKADEALGEFPCSRFYVVALRCRESITLGVCCT